MRELLHVPHIGEPLAVRRCGRRSLKRTKPHDRHELQNTREPRVEKAVEVVRNRKGGTGSLTWQSATEGVLARREWTRLVLNGGGEKRMNLMRGRIGARLAVIRFGATQSL